MKDFVQTRYMFPEHAIIFQVSSKEYHCNRDVFQQLFDAPDVYHQQRLIQTLVELVRPELKSCVVYGLCYAAERACWEIMVSHPSLPGIPQGGMLDREPLYPPSWRDQPSQI